MEAILSNDTRKLLWLETAKMLIAVLRSNFVMSFIIFFGRLSLATINQVDPFSRFLRTPTSDRHADTQTHCHNIQPSGKIPLHGPDQTRAGPHGLCRRPARTQRSFSETRAAQKSVRVRAGPCGSGRARVVEFS